MLGTHNNQKHLLNVHLTMLLLTLQYPVFQPPPSDQPSGPSCSETTSNPSSQTAQTGLTSETIQTALTSETIQYGLTSETQSDEPLSSSPENLNPLGLFMPSDNTVH